METTQAYPLCWPAGYSRTAKPKPSKFRNNTVNHSSTEIINEIKLLGGTLPIISTNIPSRGDGIPYSDYSKAHIKDLGVAIYFTYQGEQVVLACDRWDSVEDNLWAIKLAIEAMRGLDRWGVSDILKRTFTGFKALPGPIITPRKWYEVLEVSENSDEGTVKARWRYLVNKWHPDKPGGSREQHDEIMAAWDQVKTLKGWK